MATNNDENVFASPWNDSDMVLVVEDQELHVHKWILKSQSPVFKAMLDGHFQEASQEKITLKEKDLQSMVQFLKLLYPWSMFREADSPLDDKSRLSIMALADEYQCVKLIQQCIDAAEITPENVLQILPYAITYYPATLPKMYDVINWSAPTSELEEVLPKLESKEISKSHTLLLTKCRFLESSIVEMHDAMISMICDILEQKKMSTQPTQARGATQASVGFAGTLGSAFGGTFGPETNGVDSRCPHSISVREINKTKGCVHCKEKYKEKFIAPIPSCQNAQNFYNMLQRGDDVVTAVKKQK